MLRFPNYKSYYAPNSKSHFQLDVVTLFAPQCNSRVVVMKFCEVRKPIIVFVKSPIDIILRYTVTGNSRYKISIIFVWKLDILFLRHCPY